MSARGGVPALTAMAVLALIGASYWLKPAPQSAPETRSTASRGYYLIEATIRQTDAQGRIMYALKAQRIEQQAEAEQILVTQAHLQYQGANSAAWRLQAEHGQLDLRQQLADFRGAVTIRPDLTQGDAELLTDSLHVDLMRQQASTRAPVVLRMREQHLNATGLSADLKARTLRLESKVHGTFSVPEPIP